MFSVLPDIKRVIVVTGRSDMRRGIDGLAATVRLHYGLNPLEVGTIFLFCGTKRDRIKGLVFDGRGFCLVYIRLADGQFQWPRNCEEARDISPEQYQRFIDGFAIDSSINRYQKIEQNP